MIAHYDQIMGALGFFVFLCALGVFGALGLLAYDRAVRWFERRAIRRRKALKRFEARVGRAYSEDKRGVWR